MRTSVRWLVEEGHHDVALAHGFESVNAARPMLFDRRVTYLCTTVPLGCEYRGHVDLRWDQEDYERFCEEGYRDEDLGWVSVVLGDTVRGARMAVRRFFEFRVGESGVDVRWNDPHDLGRGGALVYADEDVSVEFEFEYGEQ